LVDEGWTNFLAGYLLEDTVRCLKEVLMIELVMHTVKNDMVIHTEKTRMMRLVVEIDVDEVLMIELVMHTVKNDMVIHTEKTRMMRLVVEIDVDGMIVDVVDKVTFDGLQLKQVDRNTGDLYPLRVAASAFDVYANNHSLWHQRLATLLGSRRAWKEDLGIWEEVVGGGGGVFGGVGIVCGDGVDRGVGDLVSDLVS
nr:hypothetical protein [Tanacetum cinerariifolium]